jgi:hypothetical protein
MRSHIVTAAITALIVGGASAGGATMLANHRQPAKAARPEARRRHHRVAPVARRVKPKDPCAKLAQKIVGRSISDPELHHLMRRHKNCRSVVVTSKAPKKTVTVSRPSSQQVITVPAPAVQAPTVATSPSGGSYGEGGDSESGHDD